MSYVDEEISSMAVIQIEESYMQLDAPIIIIGCGRSGSTLLDRVLNAHPDVHMLGETNFFTARQCDLFRECSDGSLWNSNARYAYASRNLFQSNRLAGIDAAPLSSAELTQKENTRIGRLVLHAISELFCLSAIEKRRWGMKEIWNGDSKRVDWDIYDQVYPSAIWVHIVRHPLDYARSAIGWNQKEISRDIITNQLQAWSRIVAKSLERKTTGRFVQVKYEDLIKAPEATLDHLFKIMDSSKWHPACLEPLKQFWVATKQLPEIPIDMFNEIAETLGVKEQILELGYELGSEERRTLQTYSTSVTYDDHGRIVINQNIQRGLGSYWIFVLSTAPAIRDEIERVLNQHRSRYADLLLDTAPFTIGITAMQNATLFEDGKLLTLWENPETFYLSGKGSFFSNAHAIIFTSSDGSDPASNGRLYSIALEKSNE